MVWGGRAKVYRLQSGNFSASLSLFGVLTFLGLFLISPSLAQAVNVEAGLDFVAGQQQKNGSWNNRVRDSVEILKALKYFGRDNTKTFDIGVGWMRAVQPENTDMLARKIEALNLVQPSSAELQRLITELVKRRVISNNLLTYGGWGEKSGYSPDPLNTYLAVRALLAVRYTDQLVLDRGFTYLIWHQNTTAEGTSVSGSWNIFAGVTPRTKESTYLTAAILSLFSDEKARVDRVFSSLAGYARMSLQTPSVPRSINWLLSTQNFTTDGG